MSEQAMKSELAILGAGPLGRAVGHILVRSGLPIRVWSRSESSRRKAKKSLGSARVCETAEEAADGATAVLLAVPTPSLREVCSRFGDVATGDQIVVHACRGIAEGFTLPHQVIREETCVRKIAVLGGPLHAVDMASGRPLAVVLASRFDDAIRTVAAAMAGSHVRVHPDNDVVGVEIAGALSNLTALAVGMADELGLDETPRGILMMRGLSEAVTLGLALGAKRETFSGLAGVGDLIPRQVATTERNRRCGARLASKDRHSALDAEDRHLEGVVTALAARDFARKTGLEIPMVFAMAAVIEGEAEPEEALDSVLRLDLDLIGTR